MKKLSDKAVWKVIAEEAFYFFSALLVLGAVVEYLFPGLFSLHVDVAIVAGAWLISLLTMVIYVRK